MHRKRLLFKKLLLFALLGALVVFIVSCGSEGQPESEGTEWLGVRVDASMVVNDTGGPTAGTVDVAISLCDWDYGTDGIPGTADDEYTYEDFYDAFGDVTFTMTSVTTSQEAPTLYITDYIVEYIPQPTSDTLGNTVYPPSLTSLSFEKSIVLPPDSTVEDSVVLIPANTKTEYSNSTYFSTYGQGNYSIKVTFYGESEFGDDFSIVVYIDALFANYDNC
ncbi:MAG: hypothetical protein AB1610_08000 [Nitrospirota bacterium]